MIPFRAALGDIKLKVQEPGVAGVEKAQPIAPGLDSSLREGSAVDKHRVAEELGDTRRVRKGQWGRRLPIPAAGAVSLVYFIGMGVPEGSPDPL